MPNCFDVASYVLERKGALSTMKLQKLVYYCQAWSLVWDEAPLFDEPIEAWANGPVVRALFEAHRGKFAIDSLAQGSSDALSEVQKDTVNAVLIGYGDKSSQWLIDLTHMEKPWRDARGNCPEGEYCDRVISHASMAEYYSSL